MSQHCDSRGCWERVTMEPPVRHEQPIDSLSGVDIANIVEDRRLTDAR